MKFCKNCGSELQEGAVICLSCGVLAGDGTKYCHNCGAQPDPLAVICVKCGCSLEKSAVSTESMTMGEAIRSCFKKYATFRGRARRSEYWYFNIFYMLCTLPLYLFSLCMLEIEGEGAVAYVPLFMGCFIQVIFFLPSLSVMVRRLHDTGKSGWWTLLILIASCSVIGSIAAIIFLSLDSQPGRNEYGNNPKSMRC